MIQPAPLGSPTWLLRLRWFAVVGQLATISLAARVTGGDVPARQLIILVAVTAATNLAFSLWLIRANADVVPPAAAVRPAVGSIEWSLMAVDLLLLTAMLSLSGGVDNPFCFFYFVNVAIGAVMLDVAAAWSLALLAFLGFCSLHLIARDVAGVTVLIADPPDWRIATWTLRQWGLVVAMGTCLSVITLFVTNMAGLLRRREAELREAEQVRLESVRLQAMTTLAAGAAHELATPLSAIDIAARELTNHLRHQPQSSAVGVRQPSAAHSPAAQPSSAMSTQVVGGDQVAADLAIIDSQLETCKAVLSRMRSAAGDIAAEHWQAVSLSDLIDASLEGIRQPHRVKLVATLPESCWDEHHWWLPAEPVAQAVRNLVHNGLDAADEAGRDRSPVQLRIESIGMQVRLVVVDEGVGMSLETARRATDPFFTTKPPHAGMGLGLFLTNNVITRLGGRLTLQSELGCGTTATLELPEQTSAQRPTIRSADDPIAS